MSAEFWIEPLGKRHDRAAFSCGNTILDQYLKTQAGQAAEKHLAAVFVLTPDGVTIAGYYALSSYVVKLDEIPDAIAKRLTRMREVPATLLGRLARSEEFRRKGIGELLLVDALKRALQTSERVGSWAVLVDAKDESAMRFYKKYGFHSLAGRQDRLFLPMAAVRSLLGEEAKEK